MVRILGISIVGLVFFVTSCSTILKVAYGFKAPSPMSDAEVVANAENVYGKTYPQHRPKSQEAYAKLVSDFEIGLPGIKFFNSREEGVSMHEDTVKSCTADAHSLIEQLGGLESLPLIDVSKSQITDHLKVINASGEVIKPVDFDHSIIVFWSDFTGKKLNKEKSLQWVNTYYALPDSIRSGVDLLLVNMDPLPGM